MHTQWPPTSNLEEVHTLSEDLKVVESLTLRAQSSPMMTRSSSSLLTFITHLTVLTCREEIVAWAVTWSQPASSNETCYILLLVIPGLVCVQDYGPKLHITTHDQLPCRNEVNIADDTGAVGTSRAAVLITAFFHLLIYCRCRCACMCRFISKTCMCRFIFRVVFTFMHLTGRFFSKNCVDIIILKVF